MCPKPWRPTCWATKVHPTHAALAKSNNGWGFCMRAVCEPKYAGQLSWKNSAAAVGTWQVDARDVFGQVLCPGLWSCLVTSVSAVPRLLTRSVQFHAGQEQVRLSGRHALKPMLRRASTLYLVPERMANPIWAEKVHHRHSPSAWPNNGWDAVG